MQQPTNKKLLMSHWMEFALKQDTKSNEGKTVAFPKYATLTGEWMNDKLEGKCLLVDFKGRETSLTFSRGFCTAPPGLALFPPILVDKPFEVL